MIIDDKRTDEERESTRWITVATDSFMSGWGGAEGGNSYFAVATKTLKEAQAVEIRFRQRPDFKRVRVVRSEGYRPNSRYCAHYSLRGPSEARAFCEGTNR